MCRKKRKTIIRDNSIEKQTMLSNLSFSCFRSCHYCLLLLIKSRRTGKQIGDPPYHRMTTRGGGGGALFFLIKKRRRRKKQIKEINKRGEAGEKQKEQDEGRKEKKKEEGEKKEPNRGLEPRTSRLLSVRTTTMLIRLDKN